MFTTRLPYLYKNSYNLTCEYENRSIILKFIWRNIESKYRNKRFPNNLLIKSTPFSKLILILRHLYNKKFIDLKNKFSPILIILKNLSLIKYKSIASIKFRYFTELFLSTEQKIAQMKYLQDLDKHKS
jgi:hypothetical protein